MSEFDDSARYHRQALLDGIGPHGQTHLRGAHVCVVGCGALGTMLVDTLARGGVGTITIIDRDLVEITNLQRQVLFDEDDVAQGRPKAEAARRAVARINRQVTVNAIVDDFNPGNAEAYASGAALLLDGLDNFATRYLLNDLAVRTGRPYLYGGAVSTTGVALAILPHSQARAADARPAITWTDDEATPCLRCLFPDPPPAGTTPTCDTAGVLATAVAVTAAHQATQAFKLLVGDIAAVDRDLISFDVWMNEHRRFDVRRGRRTEPEAPCRCCVLADFEYLSGAHAPTTISLCGREAVQIAPHAGEVVAIDLAATARRLAPHGTFTANEFLLRGTLDREPANAGATVELTLFANGRAIVKGVSEPERAQAIYDRYVGR